MSVPYGSSAEILPEFTRLAASRGKAAGQLCSPPLAQFGHLRSFNHLCWQSAENLDSSPTLIERDSYTYVPSLISTGPKDLVRAIFLLIFFGLILFGAYALQWVYYFSGALIFAAACIGLPAFAYLVWRFLYNNGRSGNPIQRRFGPIFLACFPTFGLIVSVSIINQQGSRQATLMTGELVSGYNSSGAHGYRINTVAHSKVKFTLEGSPEVYSVRAPLARMNNLKPGNDIFVCRKKGLLFISYYELTALDQCV